MAVGVAAAGPRDCARARAPGPGPPAPALRRSSALHDHYFHIFRSHKDAFYCVYTGPDNAGGAGSATDLRVNSLPTARAWAHSSRMARDFRVKIWK